MTAEFFRHFKGGVYKKIADAKHCDTEEDLVVYQNCKTGEVWVRPSTQFYGAKMTDKGPVVRFTPVSLEEKRALVNWRANPCPGTGKPVPEDKWLRGATSFTTIKGYVSWTRGRTLCPECGKNCGFTSEQGILAHKGKE